MIELKLTDIAAIVDGQLIGEDLSVKDVTTDTRAIEPGACSLHWLVNVLMPMILLSKQQRKVLQH